MKTITAVIGTRPEAIKMAPVLRALAERGEVEVEVISIGQHNELLKSAITNLDIDIYDELDIMTPNQQLWDIGEEILCWFQPEGDMMLVQGDTATTFFASLAAFFQRIPVAHIEAGLRTHDKTQPYPEEVFRRMVDVIADLHFAPTRRAAEHLMLESIHPTTIYVTGNTSIDAALSVESPKIENFEVLKLLGLGVEPLVLVTLHRRESFGEPLKNMLADIRGRAFLNMDTIYVFPVHPNPNVKEAVYAELERVANIHLLEPLCYTDLIQLLRRCSLVITDSGGIQEEASAFDIPIEVMREKTERVEGCYGDGKAGARIADILIHKLTGAPRQTTDWICKTNKETASKLKADAGASTSSTS